MLKMIKIIITSCVQCFLLFIFTHNRVTSVLNPIAHSINSAMNIPLKNEKKNEKRLNVAERLYIQPCK